MLRDLNWLRSPERIDFKLAVLVYRSVSDSLFHSLVVSLVMPCLNYGTTSSALPTLATAVFGRRHPPS